MRLLSRFGLGALVCFLVSSSIALASYSLGLWLGRNSDNLLWIIRTTVPFALLVGLAAVVEARRRSDNQVFPTFAVVEGIILALLYSLVRPFAPFFIVLELSCWVPAGVSAMVVTGGGKRVPALTGAALLCLAAIFLTEPIFNILTHNQQLTVAFIVPSEASTAQMEARPTTLGFNLADEIENAKREVLESMHALGFEGSFRVLSITRQGKGEKSLAIVIVRGPITKEAVLPVPDGSTVVYVQRPDGWDKKPTQVPVLHRGIWMGPPHGVDGILGFFAIPDAQGVSLMGDIIAKGPVQPR